MSKIVEEKDEAEAEGSEMEGGSSDGRRGRGGASRRSRSQKPRKEAVPKILDFDDVYKSEQAAKVTERQLKMQREVESFLQQDEAEQSELEIEPASQGVEDDGCEACQHVVHASRPREDAVLQAKSGPVAAPRSRPEPTPTPAEIQVSEEPSMVEAALKQLPRSRKDKAVLAKSFFGAQEEQEQFLYFEREDEESPPERRAAPSEAELQRRVRERKAKGSAFIPQFALSGEEGELSVASAMLTKPKKREPEERAGIEPASQAP